MTDIRLVVIGSATISAGRDRAILGDHMENSVLMMTDFYAMIKKVKTEKKKESDFE